MIVLGAIAAVVFLAGYSIANAERGSEGASQAGRDDVAASILFQVLVSGGMPADDASREVRRTARLVGRVTPAIDVASWAEVYARSATGEQRRDLLEMAVRLAAAPGRPIPLRQYTALLDLSFGLGFQTDALARLREHYGFEYIDHAKDARPRDADRAGGATTTFFVREDTDVKECLRVLEIEGSPTRPKIISAYRRLVSQHHPDRFFGASESERERAAARFIEITRAYEKLIAIYRD